MEKINVLGLAFGLGSMWGLGFLVAGWLATFGWAAQVVSVMSSAYIGYAPGFIGGIIGGIWGFLDGASGGVILALVYNCFVRWEKKRSRK